LRSEQGRVVAHAQIAFEPDQGAAAHSYCARSHYGRVWVARWRINAPPCRAACLVLRPAIRLRHIRKEVCFNWRRIKAITADSFKPNWDSMASKEVRSSHAISMMRDRSAWDSGVSAAGIACWGRSESQARQSGVSSLKENRCFYRALSKPWPTN